MPGCLTKILVAHLMIQFTALMPGQVVASSVGEGGAMTVLSAQKSRFITGCEKKYRRGNAKRFCNCFFHAANAKLDARQLEVITAGFENDRLARKQAQADPSFDMNAFNQGALKAIFDARKCLRGQGY